MCNPSDTIPWTLPSCHHIYLMLQFASNGSPHFLDHHRGCLESNISKVCCPPGLLLFWYFISKPAGVSLSLHPFCFHELGQIFQEIFLDAGQYFRRSQENLPKFEIKSSNNKSCWYVIGCPSVYKQLLMGRLQIRLQPLTSHDIRAFCPHSLILKSLIGKGRRCEAIGCLKKL